MSRSLLERIFAETGFMVRNSDDSYILSGMFNRYRPSGDGVERILTGDGIEGAIRARVMRIFEATAQGGNPGDLYFIVRKPVKLDLEAAVQYASDYLYAVVQLADFVEDCETKMALQALTVRPHPIEPFSRDTRVASRIWECVGNFLSKFHADRDEAFILKEAFYSMANDLILTAYLLWPAVQRNVAVLNTLDSYFNLWRHDVRLEFSTDGYAYVSAPH